MGGGAVTKTWVSWPASSVLHSLWQGGHAGAGRDLAAGRRWVPPRQLWDVGLAEQPGWKTPEMGSLHGLHRGDSKPHSTYPNFLG